jgi:hypothetical protein
MSFSLARTKPLELSKLEPVQTVSVHCEQNKIVLQTDTGSKGVGETLKSAIEDLEEGTPGVIYLDTAQYLLITEAALPYILGMENHLRNSVRVCLWDGKGSLEMADKYLSVRNDLPLLKTLISNGKINFEKS